jgi:hypothetical protein
MAVRTLVIFLKQTRITCIKIYTYGTQFESLLFCVIMFIASSILRKYLQLTVICQEESIKQLPTFPLSWYLFREQLLLPQVFQMFLHEELTIGHVKYFLMKNACPSPFNDPSG